MPPSEVNPVIATPRQMIAKIAERTIIVCSENFKWISDSASSERPFDNPSTLGMKANGETPGWKNPDGQTTERPHADGATPDCKAAYRQAAQRQHADRYAADAQDAEGEAADRDDTDREAANRDPPDCDVTDRDDTLGKPSRLPSVHLGPDCDRKQRQPENLRF
jgi:hypothetical protein